MTSLNNLKKIIPPDQAVANKALSAGLQQVKDIFNTNTPELAAAISALESNKGLDLINDLESPLPVQIQNFWINNLGTGTGPGNTITVMDMVGTAAGNTIVSALNQAGNTLAYMQQQGYLDRLTFDGGTASNPNNGVYAVMQYCLDGSYTSFFGNVVIIPSPLPGAGTYANVDQAFATGLIPAANGIINNIASVHAVPVQDTNQAFNTAATQVSINYTNLTLAGIDIANVVNGIGDGNLLANNKSSVLSLGTSLHDVGLEVEQYGAAEFFESVANLDDISGQAVIASMREGRNIALLNAVGVLLDTQIPGVGLNPVISNNLSSGQYTVSEAAGNVVT